MGPLRHGPLGLSVPCVCGRDGGVHVGHRDVPARCDQDEVAGAGRVPGGAGEAVDAAEGGGVQWDVGDGQGHLEGRGDAGVV